MSDFSFSGVYDLLTHRASAAFTSKTSEVFKERTKAEKHMDSSLLIRNYSAVFNSPTDLAFPSAADFQFTEFTLTKSL